jgi:hypothetical protein
MAQFLLVENTYKNPYSLKAVNITITLKIIALANITLIDTSVLAVYP